MDSELSPEDEALTYRSLSPLAVAGLVLGVVACAALLSPALSLLPIVAGGVSVAGLIAVARSPETRTGRGLAMTGLALSVAVGVGNAVRSGVAERINAGATVVLADRFVGAVAEGDLIAAHELTLGLRYRRPTDELARLYYASDDTAKQQLEEFQQDPAIRALGTGEYVRDPSAYGEVNRRGQLKVYWAYQTQPTGRRVVVELSKTPPRLAGPASWWVSGHRFGD